MAESIRDRANSVGRDSHPRSVDPNDARDGTYREKIGDGYHHVYLFDSARYQPTLFREVMLDSEAVAPQDYPPVSAPQEASPVSSAPPVALPNKAPRVKRRRK